MKRCLDSNKLMDALKHGSTMLSELRTSSLTPKNYYELYMAIFDELRHLTTFLYEAHTSGRHHLSDLYELVQYAGNIVPRLYLMITVGSVYMRISRDATPGSDEADAPPVKELMRDMLEMSRGVQHPTRGLFLRYYLSGMTRDYLPDGQVDGPHGTIHDSIQFILQNFIEMNKLWVRLQHLGHSREREKREQERRELRLLVGSNLVRLSQLEGLDLNIFRTTVLPSILGEIVSCRDPIAQEYLMEVIIQVFQDDFHLHTLDAFLSATAQLSRNVNVKQTREEAEARVKEAAASGKPFEGITGIPGEVELFEVFWGQITGLVNARPEFTIQDVVALLVSLMNLSLNCYPDRLDHIDTVLGFAKERVLEAIAQKAPELHTSHTKSSLLQLLLCPIQIYKYNPLTILSFPSSLANRTGRRHDLLFLQPYSTRRQVAHAIAQAILKASLLIPPPIPLGGKPFRLDSVNAVNAVFGELCSVMVREQNDGGLFGPKQQLGAEGSGGGAKLDDLPLDWDDVLEEQNMIAKLSGLPDDEFLLLSAARKHFGEGGDIRIRFTLPALTVDTVQLARKYAVMESHIASARLTILYKFIHQTLLSLSRAQEFTADDLDYGRAAFKDDRSSSAKIGKYLLPPPDMALRLFVLAAQTADLTQHEELAYEFFVQALTLYEDAISDTKAQTTALSLIIGALYGTRVFGVDNYETLVTKCSVHCSRLLKRVDQCRGVLMVSHLYWGGVGCGAGGGNGWTGNLVVDGRVSEAGMQARDDAVIRTRKEEGKVVYRDGKRVLECLQKALKIADSVMDQTLNVELFVEILERYVWYYENQNDVVAIKYLNSLIDLIQTNLANADATVGAGTGYFGSATSETRGPLSSTSTLSLFSSSSFGDPLAPSSGGGRKVPDGVLKHFGNLLAHLQWRRDEEARTLAQGLRDDGFGTGG
ncbi:vacuolar protein sorting-associated protein 35, partial [Zopfochytrium polystomum]